MTCYKSLNFGLQVPVCETCGSTKTGPYLCKTTEYYTCNFCGRAKRYSMTGRELKALFEYLEYRCMGCKNQFSIKELNIDHTHKFCCPGSRSCERCRRGVLCRKCNLGVGKAKDNKKILSNLKIYLQSPFSLNLAGWVPYQRSLSSDKYRLYRYGISEKDFDAILESQGYTCPGCRTNLTNTSLTIDHNHACCGDKKGCKDCVRGIMCESCNCVLGLVNDNTSILDGLYDYLERYENAGNY